MHVVHPTGHSQKPDAWMKVVRLSRQHQPPHPKLFTSFCPASQYPSCFFFFGRPFEAQKAAVYAHTAFGDLRIPTLSHYATVTSSEAPTELFAVNKLVLLFGWGKPTFMVEKHPFVDIFSPTWPPIEFEMIFNIRTWQIKLFETKTMGYTRSARLVRITQPS